MPQLPSPTPLLVSDTPSVHLETGHQPGYALHANLFFASEEWINPLRADVEALLSTFQRDWRNGGGVGEVSSLEDGENGASTSSGGEGNRLSPFETFKRCWNGLGWSKVLLLGCPEGPFRGRWGEGVVRAFVGALRLSFPLYLSSAPAEGARQDALLGAVSLTSLFLPAERLRKDEEPLKQVAALFALYTFWATQGKETEKVFLRVDLGALRRLSFFDFSLVPTNLQC